jgi:hypothetical protein
MNDLDTARRVLSALNAAGYSAVIAGGAARDIHLGRVPKDYDIVVLGNYDLGDICYVLDGLTFDVTPFGEGASMAGEAPLNLEWVVKAIVSGTSVDVIKQKELPTNPIQVVEGFDCTLNMAWVDCLGVVAVHPRFPLPGQVVEMLPLCDYPAARAAYLSQKFPEYIWPPIKQGTQCAVA